MKMRYLLLTTLFFNLVLPSLHAQTGTYLLTQANTEKKLKNLQTFPSVYTVIKKKFHQESELKKKQKTTRYLELLKTQDKLRKDSIALVIKYEQGNSGYKKINDIAIKIENFNASNAPFDQKKKYLISAQEIADEQGKNLLIYADESINADQKSKFFVLKQNTLDLKVHLKRILWNIEKNNPRPQQIPQTVNDQLAELQEQLKTTQKYETVVSGTKSSNKQELVMVGSVNQITSLHGTFRKLGAYFVMAYDYGTVRKNQLVKKSDMKALVIPNKYTHAIGEKSLITNMENGDYYLVGHNFLNDFQYIPATYNPPKAPMAKRDSNQKAKPVVTYTQKSSVVNTKPKRQKSSGEAMQKKNDKPTKSVVDGKSIAKLPKKYKDVLKKSGELTKRLTTHDVALRNGRMTSTRTQQWKKDIMEAEKLQEKIKLMVAGSKKNSNLNTSNFKDLSKALSNAKLASGF